MVVLKKTRMNANIRVLVMDANALILKKQAHLFAAIRVYLRSFAFSFSSNHSNRKQRS